ncbi:hypothetical protein LTR53_017488 [Teratosphaeriaceae sp. CCFEE 6253]|nr:hypothetical protein LTR53_017488 [Teratosphaeriaceae sp. CCFEE 6253]
MPPTDPLTPLLSSSLTRVTTYLTLLSPTQTSTITVPHLDDPPNPLNLLRDAATLLKAHTTKLSLLSLTPPFTPSAVAKVLRQMDAECIPALMSGVHICAQEQQTWGTMMGGEVKGRVRRVMGDLHALLEEVMTISEGRGQENGRGRGGTLGSTGMVWESCDALVALSTLGIAGLAVLKAEQYRDLVQDAIEELREWAEGGDEENEGFDELLDDGDEGVEGDRDSVEDMFNAANSLPKDRDDLRLLVEEAEGKLKKVVMLYKAVIKRRLKTFTIQHVEADDGGVKEKDGESGQGNVSMLDGAMESLRRVPRLVDELAACLYELQEPNARAALEKCIREAVAAATLLGQGWDGQGDEFTAWSAKWRDAVS